MAAGGADFRQILEHDYPHTTLVKAHPIAARQVSDQFLRLGSANRRLKVQLTPVCDSRLGRGTSYLHQAFRLRCPET
jgi:hypothetical protein